MSGAEGANLTWKIVNETSSASLSSTYPNSVVFTTTTNQLGTFRIECDILYPNNSKELTSVQVTVGLHSSANGNLAYSRYEHVQVSLLDGRPLVTGGVVNVEYLPSAEIYDSIIHRFRQTKGYMLRSRRGHSVTPLLDGTLLLAGGFDGGSPGKGLLRDSEIYDPSTDTFHLVPGELTTGHCQHGACRLQDGRVLIVGGIVGDPTSTQVLPSAEIFDPSTKTWRVTKGIPNYPRNFAHCELLPDGKILVFGGKQSLYFDCIRNAEIFDPITELLTPISEMLIPRIGFASIPVEDGRILIMGVWMIMVSFLTLNYSIQLQKPSAQLSQWQNTAAGLQLLLFTAVMKFS